MKDYRVSLETADKLKEAGFPIDRPCTDELLEELPYSIINSVTSYFLEIHKYDSYYRVWYRTYEQINAGEFRFKNLTEHANISLPEALAQMWLWLRKENLLTTTPTLGG